MDLRKVKPIVHLVLQIAFVLASLKTSSLLNGELENPDYGSFGMMAFKNIVLNVDISSTLSH